MDEKEVLRKDLMKKLKALDDEIYTEKQEATLEKNYKEWKSRKSVFMLGKAYLDIKDKKDLGISITVPGNCSTVYKVGSNLPAYDLNYSPVKNWLKDKK